jgi:hypothetical protein
VNARLLKNILPRAKIGRFALADADDWDRRGELSMAESWYNLAKAYPLEQSMPLERSAILRLPVR